MHSRLLVLDIETVPDTAIIPPERAEAFPKPIQHKVAAISFVAASLVRDGSLETFIAEECRSGGTENSSEADLIRGFWDRFAKERPRVVTWNGRGFDIPVLFQRAMVHGVQARTWHQFGDRWTGYRQRYVPESHCDLMDAISDHGASARLTLDEACMAIGMPGKLGTSGAEVASMVAEGRLADVRAYCETDVMNLFGLYARWAFTTGRIDAAGHNAAIDSLIHLLEEGRTTRAHFGAFLDKWRASSSSPHVTAPAASVGSEIKILRDSEDTRPPYLADEDVDA